MKPNQRRRKIIFKRDKNTCYICKRKLRKYERTLDHIIPLSKGGTDSYSNLYTCCKKCNQNKGSTIISTTRVEGHPYPKILMKRAELKDRRK